MTAVALVLGDPVSDLALGEAGVGLLLASVGVGHLRRVHHPFRHAVARYWALAPPSVSVASSCQLLLAPRQLGVVLLQLLTPRFVTTIIFRMCEKVTMKRLTCMSMQS